jgi:hypothetical protein
VGALHLLRRDVRRYKVPLHVSEHPGSTSLLSEWRPQDVKGLEQIPMMTLDAVVRDHRVPDYVKIDVEGFELEGLGGLSQPVSLVSFETTRDRPGNLEALRECLSLLRGRAAQIEINLTAENLEFALQQWVSYERFFEIYPKDFQDFAYRYGDLFVRTTQI